MTKTPEGVRLAALLQAYDEHRTGMSAEEKKKLNQQILSGEKTFTVPAEELAEREAAVRISEITGQTHTEARKDVEKLEVSSKSIPSLKGLVGILREGGEKEG